MNVKKFENPAGSEKVPPVSSSIALVDECQKWQFCTVGRDPVTPRHAADDPGPNRAARTPIDQDHRRTFRLRKMIIPPPHERCDHIEERAPFGRESILMARRSLLVGNAIKEPLFDQPLETSGQDVPANAQSTLKNLESTDAVEGLSQNERGPPIPEQVDRSSH